MKLRKRKNKEIGKNITIIQVRAKQADVAHILK